MQGHQHSYIRINVDKGTDNEIPYLTLGGGGVKPDNLDHPDADVYAAKLHFAKFRVYNDEKMRVWITEPEQGTLGNIDDFYIYNRPKQ